MTKEELIKKYNSLKIERDELKKKLNSLDKESKMLITENVKNLLNIEENDIIYHKSSGDAYRIYNIFIQNNEIRLCLEYCGVADYDNTINDKEFLSDYMTESQWEELGKKKIKDNEYQEYQEYLRLKDKFEK